MVRASVGVAMFATGTTPDVLLRQSDIAMYAAKAEGKARARSFDTTLSIQTALRRRLLDDLPEALTRGQLHMAYQPDGSLGAGRRAAQL